jgi:hypothetical protein
MWGPSCVAKEMCLNGGECSSDDSRMCICRSGFGGTYCEIKMEDGRNGSFIACFVLFFALALLIVFVFYACRQRTLKRYVHAASVMSKIKNVI